MAFEVYGDYKKTTEEKDGPRVDYDALNKYVVETAGLQQTETLVGIITGIVDLGIQAPKEDARIPFNGTAEDEAAEIAKNPLNYFFTEGKVRYKGYPQKPVQQVVFCVDFPEIMLDKGQFFGESKMLPLRLYVGGRFWDGTQMCVNHGLSLKTSADSKWKSFDKKHRFYEMAAGLKILDDKGFFEPSRIDEFLGKAMQFAVRVYFREHESTGKKYYTEEIKFASGLGRGMVSPELPASVTPFIIGFSKDNDEEALKHLPQHVKNTIKKAINYNRDDGNGNTYPSKIKLQLDAIAAKAEVSSGKGSEAKKAAPSKKEPEKDDIEANDVDEFFDEEGVDVFDDELDL